MEMCEGNQHCCLSFCSSSGPPGGFGCPQSPCFHPSVPQGFTIPLGGILELFICLLVLPCKSQPAFIGPQSPSSLSTCPHDGPLFSFWFPSGTSSCFLVSSSPSYPSPSVYLGPPGALSGTHPRDGEWGCSGLKGFALQ